MGDEMRKRLYAVDLYSEDTIPFMDDYVICFFITEHLCSEAFIREKAMQLLLTQCRDYHFYGAYSREWDIGFDLVDILLHPDDNDEGIALTSSWDQFELFKDALELAITTSKTVPHDVYLFYDDVSIYNHLIACLSDSQSFPK